MRSRPLRRLPSLVAVLAFALGLPLLSGGAYAAVNPATAPGALAVTHPLRTWTEAEVLSGAGLVDGTLANVAKVVRWGARVGFVGAVVLQGPQLINAGLQWFYDVAKKSTGTALDQWYADSQVTNPCPATSTFTTIDSVECTINGNSVYFHTGWNQGAQGYNASYAYLDGSGATVYGYWPDNNHWQTLVPSLASAIDGYNYWLGLAGYKAPTLSQALTADPSAAAALGNQVLPDFVDHLTQDPQFPYTYANPLPGIGDVVIQPTPTANQWFDDPYAYPTMDTDGDGWPDWVEWRLGSDPTNAASIPDPVADFDNDGFSNGDELAAGTDPADPYSRPGTTTVDSDADGIADSADPCPTDPANECGISKQLDGVAQEATLQDTNSKLDTITGLLENAGTDYQPTAPTFAQPDLSALQAVDPAIDSTPWDDLIAHASERFATVWDSAQLKMPFGMVSWVPDGTALNNITGGCAPVSVAVAGRGASLDLCGGAVDDFMTTTGRSLLLGFVWLSFIMAALSTVARA